MKKKIRQIVLDTETTGINQTTLPHINHRIIEIGAVEIINRRFTGNNFHVYVQTDRLIDPEASKVHGITNDFLLHKPFFCDIYKNFINYIKNSELIIHNASFDIGFINQELKILNSDIKNILTLCSVIDTLKIARQLFPGKRNTLDALCTRYKINRSHRKTHSAIIDAHLLGKVYLVMTGGQTLIHFSENNKNAFSKDIKKIVRNKNSVLKIIKATSSELDAHKKYLKYIHKNCKMKS
ncbi:MAG: DNA polymerase III subunit epsilon [Buchnera aphidicola (Pentalonia nigronervosa)]|jgi:DNA polymerase-3 subunit epsilon|uniref:DNA polymerase III subunit epsilon n=1 Tax=Buchnera aphidicola (Pentalonia nigronervosa) TaxID=1309793 RepID=A0A7H1AZP5_9GAMM|nr:MAG: DNA polymerase III subunit epsilon [Buchnera aphidicola (Pentalonia nigronervosa)]